MNRSYKIAIIYLLVILILMIGCLIYWLVTFPYFDSVLSVGLIITILCISIIMVGYGIKNIIKLWKKEKLVSIIPLVSTSLVFFVIFIITNICYIQVDIFYDANHKNLKNGVKKIENLDTDNNYWDNLKFTTKYWILSQTNDVYVLKDDNLLEVTFILKIGLWREIIRYISTDKPRFYGKNVDGHSPKFIRIEPKWYRLVY